MVMSVVPVSFKQACAFIASQHRHHKPPQGHKFSIGVQDDGELIGVVTVGRPVSRHLDDGATAEVTRCCTNGTKNACSKLYSAAWKAARAMGYKRLITYILDTENGASLRASNFKLVGETGGGSWSRPSRNRTDKHPTQKKLRFEAAL